MAARLLQLSRQGDGEPDAGGCEGMADGNGSAVNVEFGAIEAKLA